MHACCSNYLDLYFIEFIGGGRIPICPEKQILVFLWFVGHQTSFTCTRERKNKWELGGSCDTKQEVHKKAHWCRAWMECIRYMLPIRQMKQTHSDGTNLIQRCSGPVWYKFIKPFLNFIPFKYISVFHCTGNYKVAWSWWNADVCGLFSQ